MTSRETCEAVTRKRVRDCELQRKKGISCIFDNRFGSIAELTTSRVGTKPLHTSHLVSLRIHHVVTEFDRDPGMFLFYFFERCVSKVSRRIVGDGMYIVFFFPFDSASYGVPYRVLRLRDLDFTRIVMAIMIMDVNLEIC